MTHLSGRSAKHSDWLVIIYILLSVEALGQVNTTNWGRNTRPDSVHSDFGAVQIIYLLTYLLT